MDQCEEQGLQLRLVTGVLPIVLNIQLLHGTLIFVLEDIPGGVQRLLLALCLGIIPGGERGLWDHMWCLKSNPCQLHARQVPLLSFCSHEHFWCKFYKANCYFVSVLGHIWQRLGYVSCFNLGVTPGGAEDTIWDVGD